MKKVRIAFYRAEHDGHIVDDAISACTWPYNIGTGPYAHVEFHKPDENGSWENGLCYTSTMRDDVNGNVIRPAKDIIYKNPERWDYVEITTFEFALERAWEFAKMRVVVNPGYDILCIASFFVPFRFGSSKDICTEAVQYLLFLMGVFPKPKIWSPRRFSKKLINLGFEMKSYVNDQLRS